MKTHEEGQPLSDEKKAKKQAAKDSKTESNVPSGDSGEGRAAIVKITFEGEAARKILKCEADLKERLSKPDMGKILGNEIQSWTDQRWSEIVEENTDIDFFISQIKKFPDKTKSIKLLKDLSEKLNGELVQEYGSVQEKVTAGLAVSGEDQAHSKAV